MDKYNEDKKMFDFLVRNFHIVMISGILFHFIIWIFCRKYLKDAQFIPLGFEAYVILTYLYIICLQVINNH